MSLYKLDRDVHIFKLIDLFDLDPSRDFVTSIYPPAQDLTVISTLFQNLFNRDSQSDETAFVKCLHDIYMNLEAIRLAPIHPITQSMNCYDLADEILVSCLDSYVVCAVLDCVRAAVMTDPVVLRDFQAHPCFKFHLRDMINPTNLSIIESILFLFQFFITEYDEDVFMNAWMLLRCDYDSISVYIGLAAVFSTLAKFVPDVTKAVFFIRVFARLISKEIWMFTLDGVLSLMCLDKSHLIHYNLALLSERYLKHKTVLDCICMRLPHIPAAQLATGLRIVRDSLDVLLGTHPALGRHINLCFLLDVEDSECLCLAVDIFKIAMKSHEMTARVIQGGHLVRLFDILHDQPFPARMSAMIMFSRIIESLTQDHVECLLESGLVERLMDFLDNDLPELVRELLLCFQRLVMVSSDMVIFLRNNWDAFEPFVDSPDEAISNYASILQKAVFGPD
jgi:hypothetical protein